MAKKLITPVSSPPKVPKRTLDEIYIDLERAMNKVDVSDLDSDIVEWIDLLEEIIATRESQLQLVTKKLTSITAAMVIIQDVLKSLVKEGKTNG